VRGTEDHIGQRENCLTNLPLRERFNEKARAVPTPWRILVAATRGTPTGVKAELTRCVLFPADADEGWCAAAGLGYVRGRRFEFGDAPLLLDPIEHFRPMHFDRSRGVDAELDLLALVREDLDSHVRSDSDRFADPASEYEQGRSSLLGSGGYPTPLDFRLARPC